MHFQLWSEAKNQNKTYNSEISFNGLCDIFYYNPRRLNIDLSRSSPFFISPHSITSNDTSLSSTDL